MNVFKKIILSLLCMLQAFALFAQDSNNTTMADTMRSNGRIYVVVAVVVTILIGLILYMVRIDRKLGKLEKNNNP